MKPVSDLLRKRAHSVIHYVSPDDTVYDAIKLLADKGIGAVMVMEGDRLVGMFSERDYTRKIALAGKNSKETKVADIMTSPVLYVTPSHRTRQCMALMSEKNIRHLPVLEDGKVVGMISIRDLMNDLIQDHEFTIAQLESYIHH
jgi:CBS domain-containing protein